jgi:hypothetical protein
MKEWVSQGEDRPLNFIGDGDRFSRPFLLAILLKYGVKVVVFDLKAGEESLQIRRDHRERHKPQSWTDILRV